MYCCKAPVFVYGMVWGVTAIHSAYPEYLNASVRKLIFHKNENHFLSEIFNRVGSAKERKEVVENEAKCIVLATSGMLMGGPSVQYLKEFAGFTKNTIFFCCYQAAGTLGRRLQQGEKEISFALSANKSETMNVNLEVVTVEGFTGHSDRKQLMSYVHKCNPKPKKY